jgi:hypothetical protein
MLSVVAGLVLASALWRLPQIQRLEEPEPAEAEAPRKDATPGPTHTPATAEQQGP